MGTKIWKSHEECSIWWCQGIYPGTIDRLDLFPYTKIPQISHFNHFISLSTSPITWPNSRHRSDRLPTLPDHVTKLFQAFRGHSDRRSTSKFQFSHQNTNITANRHRLALPYEPRHHHTAASPSYASPHWQTAHTMTQHCSLGHIACQLRLTMIHGNLATDFFQLNFTLLLYYFLFSYLFQKPYKTSVKYLAQ